MARIDRTLSLGPWRPDNADFGANTLQIARGAIRKETGYESMRGFAPITAAVLPGFSECTRLIVADDTTASGSFRTYAFNRGNIYEAVGSPVAWNLVSKAGGYGTAAEDRWYTAQFGSRLYATNFFDEIQQINVGSGGLFADTGAIGIPKAKYMAVIRSNHLVLGHINDPTDGIVTNRYAWSPFRDPLGDWTDIATQSDKAEVQDIGEITGITGGEFGTLLCRNGIAKLIYAPSTLGPWQEETVTDEVGCSYPSSVIRAGQNTYWFDESGVYLFDGATVQPIGDQWVNGWLADQLRSGQEFRISPRVDKTARVVRWLFVGQNASGDTPNVMLQLKPALGQQGFTYYEPPAPGAYVLGEFSSPGFDIDSLDGIPEYSSPDNPGQPSYDDPFWQDGTITPGGIDANGFISTFRGDVASAQFDWAEGQFASGAQRSKILASLPLTEGGAPTVQIGLRNQLNGSVSFAPDAVTESDGSVPHRDEARYVTMRLKQSGDWRSATGLQVSGVTTGARG